MLALDMVEICECGLPHDLADADPDFHPESRVCPVCAQWQQYLRTRDAEEREREKDYEPSRRRRGDGRTTTLRLGPAT